MTIDILNSRAKRIVHKHAHIQTGRQYDKGIHLAIGANRQKTTSTKSEMSSFLDGIEFLQNKINFGKTFGAM